jgi:murein DD-endopeptidase MepM/ murein hydrolase activator NlpD
LTLTQPGDATGVIVRAFEQRMPVYQLGPRVWQALIGIDLDRKPGRYVVSVEVRVAAASVRGEKALVVEPRTFPTRRLSVEPDFVNPPASELARIQSEAAFIREASSHSEPARLWSSPFVRPVPDRANSRFGTRSIFNGEPRRPHGGADFLSASGTLVHAPNAGRIVAARDLYFTGNTVMIDHGLGVVSLLAHLSAMDVREGEVVATGPPIGRVGATGRVTGPHLHWGLTVVGARVDPLSVLALVGSESK